MKTLTIHTANAARTLNGFQPFIHEKALKDFFARPFNKSEEQEDPGTGNHLNGKGDDLFAAGTIAGMVTGQIPDLWDSMQELARIVEEQHAPFSPGQFVPVLENQQTFDRDQVAQFLKNTETRHVLFSSSTLEVVLIHWKPGKASDIHGHPDGGCLFKLLFGKLEELRYTPEQSPRLLGFNSYRSGRMAYIDNRMAYHQIGNPYGSSAVSLHIYLK